jgi:glucose-1-phosphate adenylyltransferase
MGPLSISALFEKGSDQEEGGGRIMEKTVAVILAGGKGKRMDVLCRVRPKPALPFGGEYSVIDFALSNCVYSGITDLAILTDYQRSYLARYLRDWGLSNSVRTFRILEPSSDSYKGTSDAVFQNLSYLDRLNARNVLILAGDHVYKMNYGDMVAFHERAKADVTVGVIRVPIEDAYRFGTVSVSDDGTIQKFVEKSRNRDSNLASMGIYVFNKDVLAERLAGNARTDFPHDFGYSILPGMVGRDRVKAYEFTGYWQDIGTPEAYYAANMELLSTQPRFSLDGTKPVLSQRLNLPPPYISDGAMVINSLISPGCVIKGYVKNSILSPGVWVDERAEVWESVVMADAFIGYHSMIDSCIIDEKVTIGRLCCIGFGTSFLPGDNDITVVGKGINVPSRTMIRRGSRVLPHADASSPKGNPASSNFALSQGSIVRESPLSEEMQENERESVHAA